jgi:hypothetical protein
LATELREKLDELAGIVSERGPIISVYINLGAEFNEARSIGARLKNLLEPIEADSEKLGHDDRLAIRETCSAILSLEPRIAATRDKCIAIFRGGQPALDELLILPRKTWDVAIVGSKPYLRPLHAALDAFHVVATVVVDPRRSEIWVSHMGDILDHAVVTTEPIRKSDYAGWHGLDEHRSRNHAEETVARHFRTVEERLLDLHDKHRLDAVFAGGREETVKAFLGYLSEPTQRLVADTFVVDVHTATPATLAAITAELEERYEQRLEMELVETTIDTARAGGLAVIGLADTIAAVNLGAVGHLIVQGAGMNAGWACPTCGWLSSSGPDCGGCGGQADPVTDILELVVARARDQGATVEHVMIPTELEQHRVGARLRFHPMAAAAAPNS